ncbi:MAG: PQQ-binding-like beta-propeller repeat protein [Bacteroidota bacterium]|nr:PQQ-binding-like beta-propeller repeat protein [Bacteroidota bacterium]
MERFRLFSSAVLIALSLAIFSSYSSGFMTTHSANATSATYSSASQTKEMNAAITNPQVSSGNPVTYHNWLVMQQTSTTYGIFWEPGYLPDGTPTSVSANYNSLLKRYFTDIGSSGLYNIATQYYDNYTGHINKSSSLGGTWLDTQGYPASDCPVSLNSAPHGCMMDADIQKEIVFDMSINNWSGDNPNGPLSHLFVVYTSWGEGSCGNGANSQITCSYDPTNGANGICGYHNSFSYNNQEVMYAVVPYPTTIPFTYNCLKIKHSPNNDVNADNAINATSHEQMEAVTNPLGPQPTSGWYDSSEPGQEIGDKCAGQFGPSNSKYNGGDVQWNGHNYYVQEEWSNYNNKVLGKGCTLSETNPLLKGTVYVSGGSNLLAFNSSDGSARWEEQTSCGGCVYTSSVVSNGIIYSIDGENGLLAINETSGQTIGTFPVNSGFSPTVVNSIVYIGGNDSAVYAFNSDGTKMIWRTSVGSGIASPPSIFNGVLYIRTQVTMSSEDLYALNASSGKLLWHQILPTGFTINGSSQTLVNGVLYYVTSYAIDNSEEEVFAFNLSTRKITWKYDIPNMVINGNPTVSNRVVYFGVTTPSNTGYIYALSATNGSEVWAPYATASASGQPAVAGGIVFDGADGVYALNANKGSLVWHQQAGANPVSSPTVIDGVVFVTSDSFYALNTADGSIRWQTPLEYYNGYQPLISLAGY